MVAGYSHRNKILVGHDFFFSKFHIITHFLSFFFVAISHHVPLENTYQRQNQEILPETRNQFTILHVVINQKYVILTASTLKHCNNSLCWCHRKTRMVGHRHWRRPVRSEVNNGKSGRKYAKQHQQIHNSKIQNLHFLLDPIAALFVSHSFSLMFLY